MSEQDLLDQMKSLDQLRKTLDQRLDRPELLAEEEQKLRQVDISPPLPKKLFTRAQIISLIDKILIAAQLLYNEHKQKKQ